MLEKIKEILVILNKGIKLLPDTSKELNKFNNNISKKQGDTTKERQDTYDKTLAAVLKMTKLADDQIYNSNKGIDIYFNEMNTKVSNVKNEIEKKGESYNNYVKQLKEHGKKIIDIVEEIRKLFDKEPLKFDFKDKDIEYPFYEYSK